MKISKKQWPMITTWWSAISNGIDRIATLSTTLAEDFHLLIQIAKAMARYEFDPHERSCGNCVFAYREDGVVKECRINPPVKFSEPEAPHWIEKDGWPKVKTEDGCGQHRGFTK